MGSQWEQLGEQIAEQVAHIDAATHRLLTDIRAFDNSGEWAKQGARSCANWLSWRVGWTLATARDRLRVANRLGELPQIDEALRHGEISYSKVRAVVRVATPDNEGVLLHDARHATASQIELICRKYAAVRRGAACDEHDQRDRRLVSRRDLDDGMVRIEATLPADEAALVWAALDRVARERCRSSVDVGASGTVGSKVPATAASVSVLASASTSASLSEIAGACPGARDVIESPSADLSIETSTETSCPGACEATSGTTKEDIELADATPPRPVRAFDRADALVTIAQEIVRGSKPNRSPTEIVISVSAETLMAPDTSAEVGVFADGTCVTAETVRRLACDCGLVYVAEDAEGRTVGVGRKTRAISGPLLRALRNRDRTCRFPGCTNLLFVEGHHIRHWADGGETSLENLTLMCSHHHRFVHEYGYRIELDPAGPRVFDPKGREVVASPEPRCGSHDALGWPTLYERNQDLAISADTNACLWDGARVDYGLVIDALVAAERS